MKGIAVMSFVNRLEQENLNIQQYKDAFAKTLQLHCDRTDLAEEKWAAVSTRLDGLTAELAATDLEIKVATDRAINCFVTPLY